MKQKIDPSLYESVFTLSSKENVDCLIYSRSPYQLENYFVKNKKILGISSIDVFPFIGAVGVNILPSSLQKISALKIVEYVSRAASVQAMIDRVNQVGIGKATTLSDKDVEKKRDDYKKQRAKNEKQLNNLISGNKKSVNRKRTFWSAM